MTKVRRLAWATATVVVLASGDAAADSLAADRDPAGIYGGAPVAACAWPSTVFIGGCTGSLVHPRVVVLAAHCVAFSPPDEILFGENFQDPTRVVALEGCVVHPEWGMTMPGDGQHDIAVCEIAEPVDDVPIVPILMGCEADMLQPGASTTLVGFGQADDALGMGPKREVVTEIQQVGTDAIWVGDDVHAACFGDSGGPAYIELPDGSWRVFGATSGPSMPSPECPQTGIWTMLHPHVPWIEDTTGLDVTPCHDADGIWNPSDACTAFPLTPGIGGGSWDEGCAGDASELGESCGPGFAGGTDTGGSSGTDGESSSTADPDDDGDTSDDGGPVDGTTDDDVAGTTTAAADGTTGPTTTVPPQGDEGDSGCACSIRIDPRGHFALSGLLWMMALSVAARRKQ
jgi:hypothetical protein